MSENIINKNNDSKKEEVLKQIEEKVKKGEMLENTNWHWEGLEFICFTDWLGYMRDEKRYHERGSCNWKVKIEYCKAENCEYGKIKWMFIDGRCIYSFPHSGDCLERNGNSQKQEQEVNNFRNSEKYSVSSTENSNSPVENNPNQEAKNTNIELSKNSSFKELMSKINIGYKEGVDYKIEVQTEGIRIVEVIDSDLKSVLRKKFNFPFGTNEYLDYYQNKEGQIFYYRTSKESKSDTMVWHEILGNNEAKFDREPKSCKVCGEASFEKDGQMQLWDGDKSFNGLRPNLIAHFHPHCVGKYFAGNKSENHDHNHSKDTVKDVELKGIEFSDSKSDNNEPVKQNNQKLVINLGNIKRIILTSKGELVIEFNGDGITPLIQNITSEQISQSQELQKAKDYLQKENKSSINKQEFDKLVSSSTSPSNESPKNNYGLLIGGGAVVLVLLGIVVGLFISRKKGSKFKN